MKLANQYEEHIYGVALESSTEIGDVNGTYGWAASVYLEGQYGPDDIAAIDHYGEVQQFIVRENSDGVVTIRGYEDEAEYARAWSALSQAIALDGAGISDDDALEAINGYLEAAVFTATDESGESLDGLGLSWSGEAQAQAREDVIDFIVSNVEAIREFHAITGHGWTQTGIDFNFDRNRHGAGFWDRGAGEVGQTLTDMAHPYGEALVIVNDKGELDFA